MRQRDDYAVQDGRNHLPNVNVVAHRQYSQSAIRFGDYVAKFVLVPTAPAQKEALNREVTKEDGPHILKKWCQDYFKDNEATYDLQAQLLENLDDQPVEDTRKDWDQSQYPFKTIAKVTIPKQDTLNPRTVHFWEKNIRVDMWHGLEEHRPLGSVNRLRKGVSFSSGVKEVGSRLCLTSDLPSVVFFSRFTKPVAPGVVAKMAKRRSPLIPWTRFPPDQPNSLTSSF